MSEAGVYGKSLPQTILAGIGHSVVRRRSWCTSGSSCNALACSAGVSCSANHSLPSIENFGVARSIQFGSHQPEDPSRDMIAGTSTQRTTVASTATATAMPRPNCLTVGAPFDGRGTVYYEGEEDGDHDHRRRGDHTRRRSEAVDDGLARIISLFPLLADVGHQEDLVVRGEAEECSEHHQRHEVDYRDGAFGADQSRGPVMVEGVGNDAEGGEDGEHVHHHRLERDQQ